MAGVSNTPVSQPVDSRYSVDVPMNGFAWDSNEGLFIPTDPSQVLLDPPLPTIPRVAR